MAGQRISKTNTIATLTARITTSYTVTVSNIGPYTATSASLRDPVATGLSCTAATCSAAINATCPVAASVTTAALHGAAGIAITLPPASTLQFQISCGVTATGAWLDPARLAAPIEGDLRLMVSDHTRPFSANLAKLSPDSFIVSRVSTNKKARTAMRPSLVAYDLNLTTSQSRRHHLW